MPSHVLCTIPTATSPINGIEFVEVEGGLQTAEPVDDETAAFFAGIEGYKAVPVGADGEPVTPAKRGRPSKAELEARAAAEATAAAEAAAAEAAAAEAAAAAAAEAAGSTQDPPPPAADEPASGETDPPPPAEVPAE